MAVCEPPGQCPSCDGPMPVEKTRRRHGKTLEHGQFELHETVYACAAGCRHRSGPRITRRAGWLAEHLMPNRVVGYDVMVFVGLQRFLQHRQRDEIRQVLKDEHGILLSTGEVSRLVRLFLEYLERLHEARLEPLRAALASDGGWPLHVDATGEDGQGTLLVALAGWRRWVLGTWKVSTERAEAILPRLRSVVRRFGAPVGVMRDLGRAVTRAVEDLVAELDGDVPVLGCHLHLLRDVGTDLLNAPHGELRALFRRFKVLPDLRALVRRLGRDLGEEIAQAREALPAWQERSGAHRLPKGREGLAAARALAQWVLDYAADGQNQGFPFDRPYLDLYDRCLCMRRAVDAFLLKPPGDRPVRRALEQLRGIFDPIACEVPFAQVARRLRKRAELFDELRAALRLVPKPTGRNEASAPAPQEPVSVEEAVAELRDIKSALEELTTSLRERRPQRGPGQDTRQAIDLVLRHLDKHGGSLWGHVVPLPEEVGGGVGVIERTNNLLENLFRGMKRGERRRSGRKNLAQDFEHLPAAAALACNLNHADYVTIVCGTLDRLPRAFAQLDIDRHRETLAQPLSMSSSAEPTVPLHDTVSSSLPTADRRYVRSKAMSRRVLAASRSRAPRTGRTRPSSRPATAK